MNILITIKKNNRIKMSLNEYKEVKRYLIGLVITIIGVAITFYFTTKFELKEHETRLNKLEQTSVSKEVNDIKLNMIINSIDEIKIDVKEIKNKK